MNELTGKVAFITGGTSGIGLGIAKALAGAGMKVAVTFRRDDHLEQALAQLREIPGSIVHSIPIDVMDKASVKAAAEEAASTLGDVYLLCNSAGVNLLAPMDEATDDDWAWVLGVNLHGVINVLSEFVPRMKACGRGGHIVNVGSMGSFVSGPTAGVYTTSKFAVRGLSECLRYCLAPHGIAVSLLCPGLTNTNIHEAPVYRPKAFADSAVSLTARELDRQASIYARGMHPDEVGRRTLAGVLRRDFYIFTHAEFRLDLIESFNEVIASFPSEEPDDEMRREIERARRQQKDAARRLVEALRTGAPLPVDT